MGGDGEFYCVLFLLYISTHASLAGGDFVPLVKFMTLPYFNPRLPRGRRPANPHPFKNLWVISTHASLAGGDVYTSLSLLINSNFNPRLPRGRRPVVLVFLLFVLPISTHASLVGGDVPILKARMPCLLFQPTPPSREATKTPLTLTLRLIDFNPRLPRGRRLG